MSACTSFDYHVESIASYRDFANSHDRTYKKLQKNYLYTPNEQCTGWYLPKGRHYKRFLKKLTSKLSKTIRTGYITKHKVEKAITKLSKIKKLSTLYSTTTPIKVMNTHILSYTNKEWSKGQHSSHLLFVKIKSNPVESNRKSSTHWLVFSQGDNLKCFANYEAKVIPKITDFRKQKSQKHFSLHQAPCTQVSIKNYKYTIDSLKHVTFKSLVLRTQNDKTSIWYEGISNIQPNQPILVQDETYLNCFDDRPSQSNTFAEALRVNPSLCKQHDNHHLECRTPLGVWVGNYDQNDINLVLKQQTVGAVHFVNQTPVESSTFADTIVGLKVIKNANKKLKPATNTMQKIIRELTQKATADVRFTLDMKEKKSFAIELSIKKVRFSPVQTSSMSKSSRYLARTRMVHNPNHDTAKSAVSSARSTLKSVKAEYKRDYAQAKKVQRLCRKAANRLAREASSRLGAFGGLVASTAGNTGCSFIEPSRSDLNQAENYLSTAKSTLNNTPRKIEDKVYKNWSYKQKLYTRDMELVVNARILNENNEETQSKNFTISNRMSDYEIESDEKHNVKGHRADLNAFKDDSILIRKAQPEIHNYLSDFLNKQIYQFTLFTAASITKSFTRSKTISDTLAFAAQIAGYRIISSLHSFNKSFNKNHVQISSISQQECILVVAVGDERGVKISSSIQISDVRSKTPAWIEYCGVQDNVTVNFEGNIKSWEVFKTSIDQNWVQQNKAKKIWQNALATVEDHKVLADEVDVSKRFASKYAQASKWVKKAKLIYRSKNSGRGKSRKHRKALNILNKISRLYLIMTDDAKQQIKQEKEIAFRQEQMKSLEDLLTSLSLKFKRKNNRFTVVVQEAFLPDGSSFDLNFESSFDRIASFIKSHPHFYVIMNCLKPRTQKDMEYVKKRFTLIQSLLLNEHFTKDRLHLKAMLKRKRSVLKMTFDFKINETALNQSKEK